MRTVQKSSNPVHALGCGPPQIPSNPAGWQDYLCWLTQKSNKVSLKKSVIGSCPIGNKKCGDVISIQGISRMMIWYGLMHLPHWKTAMFKPSHCGDTTTSKGPTTAFLFWLKFIAAAAPLHRQEFHHFCLGPYVHWYSMIQHDTTTDWSGGCESNFHQFLPCCTWISDSEINLQYPQTCLEATVIMPPILREGPCQEESKNPMGLTIPSSLIYEVNLQNHHWSRQPVNRESRRLDCCSS